MQAIGYARVSTGKQVMDGVSLDAQRERISGWCAVNGYQLVEIYVDAGMSGARVDNRGALQAAVAHACRAQAVLLTYSLSRLARSTKDAIGISDRLRAAGADLVSLSERLDTTTAAGKMLFRMLAVLAEFERDLISERTTAAMPYKQARGEYTGGAAPYGWRIGHDGVTLEPDEKEWRTIRAACELRGTNCSLRDIGRQLAAVGLLPRCGRQWHPKTVSDLLRSGSSSF